jgi:hypothetical protein
MVGPMRLGVQTRLSWPVFWCGWVLAGGGGAWLADHWNVVLTGGAVIGVLQALLVVGLVRAGAGRAWCAGLAWWGATIVASYLVALGFALMAIALPTGYKWPQSDADAMLVRAAGIFGLMVGGLQFAAIDAFRELQGVPTRRGAGRVRAIALWALAAALGGALAASVVVGIQRDLPELAWNLRLAAIGGTWGFVTGMPAFALIRSEVPAVRLQMSPGIGR